MVGLSMKYGRKEYDVEIIYITSEINHSLLNVIRFDLKVIHMKNIVISVSNTLISNRRMKILLITEMRKSILYANVVLITKAKKNQSNENVADIISLFSDRKKKWI